MMRYSVSDTAKYGDYITGGKIIADETRKAMKGILKDVQEGKFAKDGLLENQAGRTYFNAKKQMESEHGLEKVRFELRSLMSWMCFSVFGHFLVNGLTGSDSMKKCLQSVRKCAILTSLQ